MGSKGIQMVQNAGQEVRKAEWILEVVTDLVTQESKVLNEILVLDGDGVCVTGPRL
jgi:hypothetical protein